jgi:hypothetical protein
VLWGARKKRLQVKKFGRASREPISTPKRYQNGSSMHAQPYLACAQAQLRHAQLKATAAHVRRLKRKQRKKNYPSNVTEGYCSFGDATSWHGPHGFEGETPFEVLNAKNRRPREPVLTLRARSGSCPILFFPLLPQSRSDSRILHLLPLVL